MALMTQRSDPHTLAAWAAPVMNVGAPAAVLLNQRFGDITHKERET
jgi:hypothetical protein